MIFLRFHFFCQIVREVNIIMLRRFGDYFLAGTIKNFPLI